MDTYLFDELRVSFIRAHIQQDYESHRCPLEYEYTLKRLFNDTTIALDGSPCTLSEHLARLCVLLTQLMIMYIEDVAALHLWPTMLHDFRELLRDDHIAPQPSASNESRAALAERWSKEFDILRRQLRLWHYEKAWLPVIHAIHLLNIGSEPCCMSISEQIIRGNFASIACADFADIQQTIGVNIPSKLRQILDDINAAAQIFHGAARQLQQWATLLVLRIMNPCEPQLLEEFTRSASSSSSVNMLPMLLAETRERPSNINPSNVRHGLEKVTYALICQSYPYIRSITPNEFLEQIINEVRRRTGDISLIEETMFIDVVARSPIRAIPAILPDATGTMQVLLQLNRGTFIGFDGIRRTIIYGPITSKIARTCINIGQICNRLKISRDNQNGRIAKSSTGSLFFITEANMITIPTSLMSVSQIIALLRKNHAQMRIFIENCLWRAIMNFPGPSIASGILVCDDGQHIYSYGEYKICRGEMKQAHCEILAAFANDLQFYNARIQAWIKELRDISSIECASRLKYPAREEMTGISPAALSKCVARATQITDDWLRQLKMNLNTI